MIDTPEERKSREIVEQSMHRFKARDFGEGVGFTGLQTWETLKSFPMNVELALIPVDLLPYTKAVPYGTKVLQSERHMHWTTRMEPLTDSAGIVHTPKFQWHGHPKSKETVNVLEGFIYGYKSKTHNDTGSHAMFTAAKGESVVFEPGEWHVIFCTENEPTLLDVFFELTT
jgi:tellurite resistance-related uncharacterized protein